MKKTNIWYLVLVLLAAAVLYAPSAFASGCGTLPSAENALTTSCIPVNIINTQPAATPANFQDQIGFNALQYKAQLAGNLQNVYVYNGVSGSVLSAYLEGNESNAIQTTNLNTSSNVIYWVNLGANTIAATSTANGVYYLGIGQLSTNFFTSGNGIGESSLLSPSYGQYDNGNAVFEKYQVFGGLSNYPSGWNAIYSNTGTTTWGTTAVTFGSSTRSGITSNTASSLAGNVIDYYAALPKVSTNGNPIDLGYGAAFTVAEYYIGGGGGLGCAQVNTAGATFCIDPAGINVGAGKMGYVSAAATIGNSVYATNVPTLFSLGYSTATGNLLTYSIGYANTITTTITPLGTTANFTAAQDSTGANMILYWFRERLSPDNGIMPGILTGQLFTRGTLTANQPTPGSGTVLRNAMITLTSTASGGNPPYTYQWYTSTNPACSSLTMIGGATGSTYTATVAANTLYCYQVTDSNPTTATSSSASNIIVANYQIISVTGNSGNQYETATQLFTYVVNVTKLDTTANMLFVVNGNNIMWNNQTIGTGPNTFSYNYAIPLLASNAIPYVFNVILYATGPGLGIVPPEPANTIIQTAIENYFPSARVSAANIIQGENETVELAINQAQPYNAVSVSASALVGNQIKSFQVVAPYSYNSLLYSFINLQYNLAVPTYNSPVTVTANVPVQLTFNSNSVWRNQTVSFGTYLETLAACSPPTTASSLQWAFNLLPGGTPYTSNVLLSGFYTISKQTFTSNTIPGTSAGINSSATSNTYSTCIYPAWANFSTSGSFQYSANGITASNYFLSRLFTSNALQVITPNLYNVSAPTSYSIAVENTRTGQYVNALVQVLLYNSGTNSTTLVNEFVTPAGGSYNTQLQVGQTYQFYVYNQSTGAFIASSGFLQAVTCSSACQYIIAIGAFNVPFFQSQIGNIKYACTLTPLTGNYETTSCTYTSLNGTSYSTTLNVYQNKTSAFSVLACTQPASGASGSISCTVPNTNSTLYFYDFCLNLDGTCYSLQTDHFGSGPSTFAANGYLFAIMVIVLIVSLLITKSPEAALIGAGVAFILCSALFNLYNLTNLIIGGIVIMIAVPVYLIRRR